MGDLQSNWQPLLGDSLRPKIEAVIEEIAADIAPLSSRNHPSGSALGTGDAGMALFFHYLGKSRPDTRHAHLAESFLEKAFNSVSTSDLGFELFGGITGIGWVYEHLFGAQENGDAMEAVDESLLKLLSVDPWPGLYDLISGLAGMGVYALEHWPRGRSAEILDHVSRLLIGKLEPAAGGLTWFTPPSQQIPVISESYPQGHFNVGMAHGLPAVAVVLAAAGRLGPGGTDALAASREIANWILATRLDSKDGPVFPRAVDPDGNKFPSRLAWCYGDAGVAGALLLTAKALNDTRLAEEACGIARYAACLPAEASGVTDAPICHGAAGLAHIFNRFFQVTGEEVFRSAVEFWLGEVLYYHESGKGPGGFQADSMVGWRDEPGFLVGSAGIGLVLLAAAGDTEPSWDGALALSAPKIIFQESSD